MSVRRGKALTVSFYLIDAANRPFRKAGISFEDNDILKISKDGGSYNDTTNDAVHIASGRYKLDLTADEMNCDWLHLMITGVSDTQFIDDFDTVIATSGHPSGTVVSDGSNTSSTFKTDLTQATDYWKDTLLLFTTGSLINQVKKVTAFNSGTDFITVSPAFTAAPTAGDRFILINI